MSTEFRAMYDEGLAVMEAKEAWPEGVIARHLTLAGEILRDWELTVDVGRAGGRADCRGCGERHGDQLRSRVAEWTVAHAAACRALPRPGVA